MANTPSTPQQPFTRLSVPAATPDVAAAVSDIYDKLASNITTPPNLANINSEIAALQKQVADLIATTATAQPSGGSGGGTVPPGPPKPALDITGAIGRAANPQYAYIPALDGLPSTNPTTGAPYAQDGEMIELTTAPDLPGTLYRYDLSTFTWAGPMLGAILADTHANRTNYDPVDYKDIIYYETDRKVAYYSDGTNWIYLTGEMQDTFANRPADLGAHDANFLFLETSRSAITSIDAYPVYRWTGAAWLLTAGTFARTQAQLATLAATLTTNDVGAVVLVTDYNHRLRWSGSAWGWDDGEDGSGYIMPFLMDPSPSTGWQVCDGTTATYLKSDGSTGSQALPDLVSASANAAYLKYGSPASATPNAAVAPTLTMDSYTPAGTNSAPTLTMNSYTPAGSVSSSGYTPAGSVSAFFTGTNTNLIAPATATTAVLVTTSGAVQVAAQGHTHTTNYTPSGTIVATFSGTPATITSTFTGTPATLTGTVSAPTFTGTPAVLTGTISNTGQPRNIILRPFFRL